MNYNFTLPNLETPTPPTAQGASWETVTLSLPADTPLAVPNDPDRWERTAGGRILATYTRDELRVAVALALDRQDTQPRRQIG